MIRQVRTILIFSLAVPMLATAAPETETAATGTPVVVSASANANNQATIEEAGQPGQRRRVRRRTRRRVKRREERRDGALLQQPARTITFTC